MLFPVLTAGAEVENSIRVTVQNEGDLLTVNSEAFVRASPEEVWAVMIDFDHMARFISNLRSSRVLSRDGGKVKVEQKGRASAGLLFFDFESVREMDLTPYSQIHSRQISGSMAKFDGTTVLRQEGDLTRIESRVLAVPGTWVPPIFGKRFIESETREQFSELLAEIARRQEAAKR
ncbi:MAG TPA: SRPBCC family protein [Rhodocyclaceae bacterium]|nr:SRPBCC family protein [Rhodocyclaceae bacterium]